MARFDDLTIASLIDRVRDGAIGEVVLAVNATVDGQTTAHYVTDLVGHLDVKVTRLAHGVPVGGELDYLDDGTLAAANYPEPVDHCDVCPWSVECGPRRRRDRHLSLVANIGSGQRSALVAHGVGFEDRGRFHANGGQHHAEEADDHAFENISATCQESDEGNTENGEQEKFSR